MRMTFEVDRRLEVDLIADEVVWGLSVDAPHPERVRRELLSVSMTIT